tara:strand:- start:4157 stop:4333 length:177 start_codon:yes stop_codon:yes gene_type:complete
MPDYGRDYNLPGYSHNPLTDAAKASDSKSEPPATSSSGKGGGKKKAKKNNPKKGKGGY